MNKELITASPTEMQMATQLESIAKRYHDTHAAEMPYWEHELRDGHVEFFKVTPQMVWGLYLARKTRFHDVERETAEAVVEKFLDPGERIHGERAYL